MQLEIIVTDKVDKNEWNKNLIQNSNSTAYQIPERLQIYSETYGTTPIYIQVLNSKGKIVGQLAAQIQESTYWSDANVISRFIGKKFNLRSMLTWFYGPIIHDKENEDLIMIEILKSLDSIAVKNNVTMIRGSSPPSTHQFKNSTFLKKGYQIEDWATYVINLKQNMEDLFNLLDKKTRYDVRKGEKNNLTFEVADSRKQLSEYAQMKINSKTRSGRIINYDPKFHDKHWDYLYKNDYEKLFLAKYNDEYVGGILCLIFNNNVIQHSLVNTEKTSLAGGPFLTWNTIKWLSNAQMNNFDFAGINPNPTSKKEEAIDFYKSKWGGIKKKYFWYNKIINSKKIRISSAIKNPGKAMKKMRKK